MPEPREQAPARAAWLGALACPRFARLLSGQAASQVGTQMSNTAGAWILYRLTHSALALGIQGLGFSLPIAVLPLLTGTLADRFSRLTLVKATLAVEAGQAFVLAAVTAAGGGSVLLAGGSLCMTVIQVVAGTMVQQSTADAMRGRISALGSAGQNGLAGIAAAATTALAARIGPGLAVGMLAAVTASPGPCCRGSPRIRGPVRRQGQSRALVIMGVAGGHRSGVMFLIVEIIPKLAGYHGG